MPRPARFSDDDVLDAAQRALVEHGRGASIAQVAACLDGPVGSIYHRFASRDELFARLWLRSIDRFHGTQLPLLDGDDPHDVLVASAVHVPSFCRAHPDAALAMTLHRQDRLLTTTTGDLAESIRRVNDELDAATARLVERRYGTRDIEHHRLVLFATRIGPYGLVRPYLGRGVPAELDAVVAASADAILRLGD